MLNQLFPLLNAGDEWLVSTLPVSLSVSLWGVVAGILAMGLYGVISPQKAIAVLTTQARQLRQKMSDLSLDATEFSRLGKENVKTSLALLAKVFLPALLSSLPILIFALWLNIMYGYQAPQDPSSLIASSEGRSKNITLTTVEPPQQTGTTKEEHKILSIQADGKTVYTGNPFQPPTPVIHKRAVWNTLIENPIGYLDEQGSVDVIHLNLPTRQVLTWTWLPNWATGWETPFFLAVFAAALGIKLGFRIH